MIDKIKKEILWLMPHKLIHKLIYKKIFNKKLNLKNPQDLNEKLQWLILNEYGKKYGDLADKIKVRDYVEKIEPSILIKLYGTYRNPDEIELEKLPDKFVLKTNHGSGKVYICTNKESFDFENIKKELKKELKDNFAKTSLEYHYKYIKPMIMCEEYLEDNNRINPLDYKIYCFNGKANCILLCSNRENQLKLDYYDLDWNYLDYSKEQYKSNELFNRPKNLKEMIKIAEKLSKDFKFVRVDLYNIDGKISFGELTFTPAAGRIQYNTDDSLKYLGSLIEIETKK